MGPPCSLQNFGHMSCNLRYMAQCSALIVLHNAWIAVMRVNSSFPLVYPRTLTLNGVPGRSFYNPGSLDNAMKRWNRSIPSVGTVSKIDTYFVGLRCRSRRLHVSTEELQNRRAVTQSCSRAIARAVARAVAQRLSRYSRSTVAL